MVLVLLLTRRWKNRSLTVLSYLHRTLQCKLCWTQKLQQQQEAEMGDREKVEQGKGKMWAGIMTAVVVRAVVVATSMPVVVVVVTAQQKIFFRWEILDLL